MVLVIPRRDTPFGQSSLRAALDFKIVWHIVASPFEAASLGDIRSSGIHLDTLRGSKGKQPEVGGVQCRRKLP